MATEPTWVHNDQGERSAAIVNIDNGKYVAVVAVLAVFCGACTTISWTLWRAYHDDSVDVQDQYQKERNHVIELEARLKILGDEVQELKHERR